jgi:hypothetical protein
MTARASAPAFGDSLMNSCHVRVIRVVLFLSAQPNGNDALTAIHNRSLTSKFDGTYDQYEIPRAGAVLIATRSELA